MSSSKKELQKDPDGSLKHARSAFDHKDYNEAIKITSDQINQLRYSVPSQTIASLYYIRAMAKGKIAKFDAAERDASSILHLDVKSVPGHLCLANLYAMQGKQAKVIDICEKASKVLRRRKDPLAKKQLLDFKANAEECLRARVDFVTCLSQELLVQILKPFATEELAVLALVSLSWYNQIAQCKSLWRSIELSMDSKNAWLVIPSVGQHVWNASYLGGSQRTWRQRDLGVTEQDFEKQALRYCKSIEPGMHLSMCIIYIMKYLPSSKDYHGKIDTAYMKYHFGVSWHLNSVFAAFPNIKRLEFDGGSPDIHCDGLALTPQLLHLTTLKLSILTIQQIEHVEMILRRCPTIRRLSISKCNWRILKVIEKLTALEVLVFHAYLHRRLLTLEHQLMNAVCTKNDPPAGLRSLALVAACEDYNAGIMGSIRYNISGLVTNNCDTLEELIVTCVRTENYRRAYSELSRYAGWDRIMAAHYPKLRRLYCIIPNSKENAFAAMLRQCTGLVDCAVFHPVVIHEVVVDALSTVKSLRRLELTFGAQDFIPDELMDDIFVEEFGSPFVIPGLALDGLRKLLTRSAEGLNGLQHLCFTDCTAISPGMLDLLATSGIRGIEFSNATFYFHEVRDFVIKLDLLPSLEWVFFDSVLCIGGNGDDHTEYNEWVLGMRYELISLRLKQFSQCPTLLGEDMLIVLLNKQKHSKLIYDLQVAEGTLSNNTSTSNIVYPFLQKTLDL
ncbi:hypothetical protein BJV82DRAFT_674897 [Fennellomyces sp. T-0311]|nr:hypothetical protein BJV82DRAFT_674897 [Fennellomyces sp. T-0311]